MNGFMSSLYQWPLRKTYLDPASKHPNWLRSPSFSSFASTTLLKMCPKTQLLETTTDTSEHLTTSCPVLIYHLLWEAVSTGLIIAVFYGLCSRDNDQVEAAGTIWHLQSSVCVYE